MRARARAAGGPPAAGGPAWALLPTARGLGLAPAWRALAAAPRCWDAARMSLSAGRAGAARAARVAARSWRDGSPLAAAAPLEPRHAEAEAPRDARAAREVAARGGSGGGAAAAAAARGSRRRAAAAAHRGFAAQAAPEAPVDPFSIVTDELEAVSERMRKAVVSEVRWRVTLDMSARRSRAPRRAAARALTRAPRAPAPPGAHAGHRRGVLF